MNYKKFTLYIEKIVTYQARNKKHRDWTYRRKTELNMTTRQLAEKAFISQSTASRYINRMKKEGMLVNCRHVKKENLYRAMKFYQVTKVMKRINAIAKKRAFLYIQKAKKIDASDSLKYLLTINKNSKKQRLVMSDESGAILKAKDGSDVFLDKFNIRKWKEYGVKQTETQVSNYFAKIRLSI